MPRKALLIGLLLAGGGLAACADDPRPYGPPPGEHVRWCLAHHPGYDPRSNLFPGPDGRPHVCRFRAPPPGYYAPPPPPPPPGYYAPPPPPPPPPPR